MAAKTRTAKAPAKGETFTCPDCGRTFTRAAALGAHRRQAHGVAGNAARAATRRRRAPTKKAAAVKVQPRRRAAPPTARRHTRARTIAVGRPNHDVLLKALFPQGMPAQEEVIHSVNTWLAEADRLAKLR